MMANARTRTQSSSVICATWQFIKNVTVFHMFRKASGCVVGACNHHRLPSTVFYVPTKAAPLNRPTIIAGLMSLVLYGYLKCVLETQSFSNQSKTFAALHLNDGS